MPIYLRAKYFIIFVFLIVSSNIFKANEILSDSLNGTIIYNVYSVSDQNQWQISPNNPSSSKILFIFQSLNIQQAELRIFDSSSQNTGQLIYNCVSCGNILPPPFFSKTGNVIVYITGTSGVSFSPSNFDLQYFAVPNEETYKFQQLTMNLNMGYAQIFPLNVNGKILKNSVQKWKINLDYGTRIIFSFANFIFPKNCSSVLNLYETIGSSKNLIYSGCKDSDIPNQWLYSYTGAAMIELVTTETSATFFQVDYFSDYTLYNCGSFLQPDTLISRSMALSDGSKYNSLMKRAQICSWKISPLVGNSVNLIFERVSMKYGSSIIVYDNDKPTGSILWDGTGATLTIPPIIKSTRGSLFVVYSSDSSNSVKYLGFLGEYYTNFDKSLGSGRGYSTLSMSSNIDVSPPGNGTSYTNGVNYTWYIKPKTVFGPITFAFSELNLKSPEDCLTIFEGDSSSILASFRGRELPKAWYTTSSSSATMVFYSKFLQNDRLGNFRVSYFSDGPNYHCGFTTNPAVLNAASYSITDGSSSVETVYPNQNCEWLIQPLNGANKVFIFFSRYGSSGTLSIYKGIVKGENLIYKIENNMAIPASLLINSSIVTISYVSRSDPTGYGFSLTYYGISDSTSFPGNGITRLYSSNMLSLGINSPFSKISIRTNLTWQFSPISSGPIYFAVSKFNFTSRMNTLELYDGLTLVSPLLESIDAHFLTHRYKWLKSSNNKALLHFKSGSKLSYGDFSISYYSDGPNYNCGIVSLPAVLDAPSMILTDGSSSTDPMNQNQKCEWLIQPVELQNSTMDSSIVIEFIENDLRGGLLEIFDGDSQNARLLWRCFGCDYIPLPIISSYRSLFVRFETNSSFQNPVLGMGFLAIYWTISRNNWKNFGLGQVLQIPKYFEFSPWDISNVSAAFSLETSDSPSMLEYLPQVYGIYSKFDIQNISADGRDAQSVFSSLNPPFGLCGFVNNSLSNKLTDKNIAIYASTQKAGSYIKSSADYKTLLELYGSPFTGAIRLVDSIDAIFKPLGYCQYRLDSGSSQAIIIKVQQFINPMIDGRLVIYGGLYGDDAIIFDSLKINSNQESVIAPCGKANIFLYVNHSNPMQQKANYSLNLIYQRITTDNGLYCQEYYLSLHPPPKQANPYIPYYIAGGSFVASFMIILGLYYSNKLKSKRGYLFYPENMRKKRKYTVITPNHPKYNPRWDTFLNKFLWKGKCSICGNLRISVIKLSCGHGLCLDDLMGYLNSALGDISMFPVKCPMHYEGCKSTIGPKIAKRILSKIQYDRFLEFSDRAIYGDGMRCIFCNNFVNFPENMVNVSRVECPYCLQKFCIRCKKPWHFNNYCPLDKYDNSVEVWKSQSGAQKCPSCLKLIEKDDPDTCNHMVHKITDAIPCIKERTDFCYCCGEEVTSDYPHVEIRNIGINHFPEGVFQNCRIVILKQKEVERERLKKQRRLKNRSLRNKSIQKLSIVHPSDLRVDETNSDPERELTLGNDTFDQYWGSFMDTQSSSNRELQSPSSESQFLFSSSERATRRPNSHTQRFVLPNQRLVQSANNSPIISRPKVLASNDAETEQSKSMVNSVTFTRYSSSNNSIVAPDARQFIRLNPRTNTSSNGTK